MVVEQEAKSTFELKLLDDNKAHKVWEERATKRVTTEKKKAEEECTRANEAEKRVEIATKWAEHVDASAVKAVEAWRASFEFDALVQDAYVVALEELIKHVGGERPDFDKAFLVDALGKQKEELWKLSEAVKVRISPTKDDVKENTHDPRDLPAP